jgi:protein arginine N-methyltransferase 1
MLIEYHRTMLADQPRNTAFYNALKKVIVPGKTTVADIGCGTGVLGFMARKLGAKDVYFYESASIIAVAQKLAKANKMTRCHFFAVHSAEMIDPPQVDLVVSETLGNYAFEENIIDTMNDAKRFLKPGGILMPQGVTQFACPIVAEKYHRELTIWDDVGFGLDFGVAKEMSLNNIYVRSFAKADLLDNGAAAAQWDGLDFRKQNSSKRHGKLSWTMKSEVTITGLAVWWDCALTGDIQLSTSPFSAKGHWEQLYFPIDTPLKLKKGDTLTASISSASSGAEGTDIRWSLGVKGDNARHMSLRRGYLA